jgi:polyhydroxyalkanoate synthesis regulator phasin
MDTEFWKKLAYTAVGYAMINPDTVKELTDKLMAAGKMTEAEGESFLKELVSKGTDMRAELDKRIHDISTEVLTRMNVATQDDVKALQARLAALEAKPV